MTLYVSLSYELVEGFAIQMLKLNRSNMLTSVRKMKKEIVRNFPNITKSPSPPPYV